MRAETLGTPATDARESETCLPIAEMTGAMAIVECLRQEGVAYVFGYPGAAILPFYEALRESGIRHVLTRSEQGAGHAASGYARMTGRPAVCVTTSGPGATNLFTPIATAYSDSIPIIAITGQVAADMLGRDVFQEVDTTGAVQPFSKYSYLVKTASEIGRVFKEAFHIASTGRRGPVLIDIPVDIQRESAWPPPVPSSCPRQGLSYAPSPASSPESSFLSDGHSFSYPEHVSIRGYKPRFDGHALQVRRVAEAIKNARRPVLCLGGGVFLSGAVDTTRAFCERVKLPVVSTLMGIGALPPSHPRYYGMIGQSGHDTANSAINSCDLLVILGARVGDRAFSKRTEASSVPVVHIDIDSAEIGKNIGAAIPLVGDASRVLAQLMEYGIEGEWHEWTNELDILREAEEHRFESRKTRESSVDPARFVRELTELLPDDAVYVADVGQNQLWSAKNYRACGRFLTTGGMGTMGYSIPAAVGAALACSGRAVIAVCGDGSFQMSMNELATIKHYGLPIKIVVIVNGQLGLIRELQQKGGLEVFSVELAGFPDLSMIASAYGMGYARLKNTDAAKSAIQDMLAYDGAYLLECVISPEEET